MAASQTIPWRLIAGILGVLCLVLMITLGILLRHALTKQSMQPTSSPEPTTEPQQGSGCCSCQEKWVGHKCNCYLISNERKTWAESRNFCASQNSSLLQLQNKDELNFIKTSKSFYWIGLSYSEEHQTWLWEDGSALSQDLFLLPQGASTRNCITYSTSNSVLDDSCEEQNRFICKQWLT
ncbi:natural killer cells antigen CD94-like [Saccopteryx leptura]|uniref:natural killer cells antigen CD94-like n=1 Tax=Saccopteryx leptura TaxID=249018 RepID=UPI00339BB896